MLTIKQMRLQRRSLMILSLGSESLADMECVLGSLNEKTFDINLG